MDKCQIIGCTVVGECSEHKCFLKGCSEPKASLFPLKNTTGKIFCLNHMCQAEECRLQAKLGSRQCFKHTCGKQGCWNPITEEFVMCEKHRCPSITLFSLNPKCVNDQKCPIHVCEKSWCKTLKKENSKYCSRDSCINPGCKEGVYEGKTCEKHGCHYQVGFETGCGKLALEGSNTCLEHKCSLEECLNPKIDTRSSFWCRNHGCYHIGCDVLVRPGTNYCELHGCEEPGCSLSRLNNHVHHPHEQELKVSEKLLAVGIILLAASFPSPTKR